METYTQITTNHLLSLIADKNTKQIFYKSGGNLYPLGRTEFSFAELHTRSFYIKEVKENKSMEEERCKK